MSSRSNAATAGRRRVRVAPRSRARGTRIDWDRAGRHLLVLVLVGLCIYYVNPVMNFHDAWKDARASNERVAELRSEKRLLQRRAEALSGKRAAETQARRLGLVAEGERSFSIRGIDP